MWFLEPEQQPIPAVSPPRPGGETSLGGAARAQAAAPDAVRRHSSFGVNARSNTSEPPAAEPSQADIDARVELGSVSRESMWPITPHLGASESPIEPSGSALDRRGSFASTSHDACRTCGSRSVRCPGPRQRRPSATVLAGATTGWSSSPRRSNLSLDSRQSSATNRTSFVADDGLHDCRRDQDGLCRRTWRYRIGPFTERDCLQGENPRTVMATRVRGRCGSR